LLAAVQELASVAALGHIFPPELYPYPRWGRGLADERHDRALGLVRELGSAKCHLWVLEENARARRFYERRGWRENGRTRVVEYPLIRSTSATRSTSRLGAA
jgi:hypothetical protein